MTYNKVSNKAQDKDVKYINKDYNSFKNSENDINKLILKRNYPRRWL